MGLLDDELGAAFGVFPQMKPRRRFQDPEASANVPLDVTRGRLAGLLGLLPDTLNFMGRSPMPTEMFGETQYEPAPQLPYGSEYYLENLPLKPTSRVGEVAGQAGAFVPLNPMPAARAVAAGAKALGPTAVRMGEGYLQRQGLMPGVVPEPPVSLGTPVTPLASMIEKPQAPVSPVGFYSAAEQAALNLPRKSGTGESFLNDLMKGQDVKKEELSWLGLDDYLKGKPNVTRQEVQDFIAGNRVDVQEVRLGEAVAEDPIGIAKRKEVFDKYESQIQALEQEYQLYNDALDKQILEARNKFADAHAKLNTQGRMPTAQDYAEYDLAYEELKKIRLSPRNRRDFNEKKYALFNARDAEANAAYVVPEPTPTKYQNYQLPGGENYREILLTLPFKEPAMPKGYEVTSMQYDDGTVRYFANTPTTTSQGFRTQEEAQAELSKTASNLKGFREKLASYQSDHFNEPNILAHMRVNDRVDADGKKMLLIEEIQSDWHQAGREKGYQNKSGIYGEKVTPEEYKRGVELQNQQRNQSGPLTPSEQAELSDIMTRLEASVVGVKVPDAPFKDTWHQLALKRALKYAADNGYDRVGLTTGKQQIERYANELRQNVDELQFFPIGNQNNILISAKKGGKQTFSGTVANNKFIDGPAEGKTVTEVLGKSMAKQIAEKKDGVIKGDDLTIGGEGMKAYYDEIYPAFLAKQGKKYNAKTGETRIKTGQGIPGGAPIRFIDISPEMRGGVKKGQPLFTAAPIGGIGLGAGMQDNEMPDAVRQYMANPTPGLLQDEDERKLGGLLYR